FVKPDVTQRRSSPTVLEQLVYRIGPLETLSEGAVHIEDGGVFWHRLLTTLNAEHERVVHDRQALIEKAPERVEVAGRFHRNAGQVERDDTQVHAATGGVLTVLV